LFCWSLVFAGGNGLYRLDIIDHFFFGHLFLFVAVAQFLLIGFYWPVTKLRHHINQVSHVTIGPWFDYLIKYITPAILIGLYISSLPKELEENYEGYSDALIYQWGVIPIVVVVVGALVLTFKKTPKG